MQSRLACGIILGAKPHSIVYFQLLHLQRHRLEQLLESFLFGELLQVMLAGDLVPVAASDADLGLGTWYTN